MAGSGTKIHGQCFRIRERDFSEGVMANPSNAALPKPVLLGLRATFGFGDRLGMATPGHIAACRRGRLLPVFAQQSVRELSRAEREPEEVLRAAQEAVGRENWAGPWGADADHLKGREDVNRFARAGFTLFTIDPSEFVNPRADCLQGKDLAEATEEVIQSGAFESLKEVESLYLKRSFDLPGSGSITFCDTEVLYRAVAKYGKAIARAQEMAQWIEEAKGPHRAEMEISLDETETPTTPHEHLLVALELKRRGVPIVSLAPRFVGEFEKGVDYKGNLKLFECSLKRHAAIAQRFGPYKISVHSGSDKFKIYPILGRVCGELLHVKTAGTSYLEALRVVARKAPGLFLEVVEYCLERFETDRSSYSVSADASRVRNPASLGGKERERVYLDEEDGRQILHVTFGSVLTRGRAQSGRPFKEAILETLDMHKVLYRDLLADRLGRHIEGLEAG